VENIAEWHYAAVPNLHEAQKEHDELVSVLKRAGVEVFYHEETVGADTLFVHDPVLQTDKGAIILRMGKLLRRGEEAALEKKLNKAWGAHCVSAAGRCDCRGG